MIRTFSEFLPCPFKIIVDTREQLPYTFENIKSNKDEGNRIYVVQTVREGLDVGDYTIAGLSEKIIIERKSKADLFQSILKRDNFLGRLRKMEQFPYSAVIVEDDLAGIANNPPQRTKLDPKSVIRTIYSWDQQFRVKWHLVKGRRLAEHVCFRMLQICHRHHTQVPTRGPKKYEF